MKKIFLSFFVFFTLSVFSMGIFSALELSKFNNKNIALFFYVSNDKWDKIADKFFSKKALIRLIKKYNVVFLDKTKYKRLSRYYHVNGGNYLILIDKYGREIERINLDFLLNSYDKDINSAINYVVNFPYNFYTLKKMTEKYPDNYFFKYKLALAYAERKNFNEAEKTMAEVIKLIPTNPTFYLKLGEFMFKNGKYERVISVLKVALPLADDSLRPYFYFYIAKAYYALGDYKKSEKFLTYLSDSDYEVLKLKFYVYTALNEKKAAEKVLIVLKNNYKNEEVKHLEYLFNELFK